MSFSCTNLVKSTIADDYILITSTDKDTALKFNKLKFGITLNGLKCNALFHVCQKSIVLQIMRYHFYISQHLCSNCTYLDTIVESNDLPLPDVSSCKKALPTLGQPGVAHIHILLLPWVPSTLKRQLNCSPSPPSGSLEWLTYTFCSSQGSLQH